MLALTASSIAASPAVAGQSITYAGEAFFRSYSSRGGLPPGGLTGVHPYRAVFRYDDSLALLSAGFSVDGVARESFICPSVPACVDLSTSAVHVGSTVATTPEDGVEASVHSPSMFGGRPLFGTGRRIYDVLPGDDSSAFLTFALFDRPGYGFAYSYGIGSVSQVVTGVPEPSSWALMIAGFGTIGLAARRRRMLAAR